MSLASIAGLLSHIFLSSRSVVSAVTLRHAHNFKQPSTDLMLRSARRARLEAWPQARYRHLLVARAVPLAMLRDGRHSASKTRVHALRAASSARGSEQLVHRTGVHTLTLSHR